MKTENRRENLKTPTAIEGTTVFCGQQVALYR
jgi:hypothetical protein